ncbi:MAG TPA: PLP-dependent aminotransferase family protein [Candidatus Limnocylindrales bacterium]|nr:PLP-dependent aminotransferase family protein [Candidatus Limnocylindrales bacterium]
MELHVSLVGRRDLAGEIYRQLRAAILERRLRAGERLPPTREMAARLSVSRTTVGVAYDRLISEGFAVARVGAGTFVGRHVAAEPSRLHRPHGALRPRPAWLGVPQPANWWREAEFDFRPGIPDASLFPYRTWRRLVARHLRPAAVGRGTPGEPAGHAGLRAAIAAHVGASRAIRATADDIVVTNGTQQAVDLIARVLLAPGDRVAVEDPGYGTPRRLLAAVGARLVPVPVDGEGLVVDAIPPDVRLVNVSPSHQFPLGMSMSLGRRLALIDWAERHDAAVLEDDYDSEFRFDGRPIEPLHSLDPSGRVIYVGSFSKTMLATLRLGFVVVPASIREAVQAAKYLTDWHSPLPLQAALASFIDEGWFARHLRRMRTIYRERHELIAAFVADRLGAELRLVPSSVGLHLAAEAPPESRLASPDRVAAAVRRASAAGVETYPLSLFAAGDSPRCGIVLGYGGIAADRIPEGLRRLEAAFRG